MSRICVIDNDFDHPAPPFLQEAFAALGHETATVFASTRPRSELQRQLESCQAELFVSIQNVAFLIADLLISPRLSGIKKALLFYDDPMSSFLLFGRNHPFIQAPAAHNVLFFIWDGWWREKMRAVAGWQSIPTHLAAETSRFSPDHHAVIPAIAHCVVFMGNIPSLKVLEEIPAALPDPHRKAALLTRRKIAEGPYALNPFDALDEVILNLPSPDREQIISQTESYLQSCPDFSRPLAPHIQLRKFAWHLGKRETRLRALRAAVRAGPLAILSNLKQAGVAGERELQRELTGPNNRELLFVDTSQAAYHHLAHLYRSGLLQLQSTDPQSVAGGIPYRVFQSAACAVPLLSDFKQELGECFASDQEILLYKDNHDLPDALQKALANPARLREIGDAAHQRFLKEHTWTHRMAALLAALNTPPS